MHRYAITQPLVVGGLADPRSAELSYRERNGRGCRVLGGDRGDLHFDGYTLDEGARATALDGPVLVTAFDGLTGDEAFDIASEIIAQAVASVGLEALEVS